MSFAIMRCKKITSFGCLAASLQHCYRERETPNADGDRTPYNQHLVARSTDEAMGHLRNLLPEKRRKDAVIAIEYVFTASPAWWEAATKEQQEAFLKRSQSWLAEKYGTDRIIVATIHRDETSPHLSAFVVPLTQDNRLSAKEFIGGRDKMSQDQTSFAAKMQDLGLERGIEGSKATHQRIKSFYREIAQSPASGIDISPQILEPRILEKRFLTTTIETKETIAQRISDQLNQKLKPTFAAANATKMANTRAAKAEATTQQLRKRLEQEEAKSQALEASHKKLVELVAEGGRNLEIVQQRIRDNLANEKERQQAKSQGKARSR